MGKVKLLSFLSRLQKIDTCRVFANYNRYAKKELLYPKFPKKNKFVLTILVWGWTLTIINCLAHLFTNKKHYILTTSTYEIQILENTTLLKAQKKTLHSFKSLTLIFKQNYMLQSIKHVIVPWTEII